MSESKVGKALDEVVHAASDVSSASRCRSGTRRDDPDPIRSLDHDLGQGLVAEQDMPEVEPRCQAKQHIDVGQSEVRIQHDDLLAQFGQADRQVRHHICLPDTAFAAGYRNDPGSRSLTPRDVPPDPSSEAMRRRVDAWSREGPKIRWVADVVFVFRT